MYAGYTICTSREHIVNGAFCGSTVLLKQQEENTEEKIRKVKDFLGGSSKSWTIFRVISLRFRVFS